MTPPRPPTRPRPSVPFMAGLLTVILDGVRGWFGLRSWKTVLKLFWIWAVIMISWTIADLAIRA